MAHSVRSRRVIIAASALSFTLLAPLVAVPHTTGPVASFASVAHAQTADAFNERYTTASFWNANEAVVEGLELDPGTTVASVTNTIFNWGFRNDDGQLILIRPRSATAFRTGDQDIRVRVTPENGSAYTTTLKVTVVDTNPEPEEPETEPEAPAQPVDKQKLDQRYDTANFWNADEAVVEGLTLDPGTKLEPTTNTIFNWGMRNDDGQLTLIRPQSPTAFREGNHDIRVKVTEANGTSYNAVLKVNVTDKREVQEWEEQLKKTYDVDFEKSAAPKAVSEIELPEGVTISKGSIAPPPGWSVSVENGVVNVKPPATFTEGFVELPIKVNDGTDQFDAKLRINAKNPQTSGSDIAGGAAGLIGSILGNLLGLPNLGNGGGGGRGLLEGLVKVEVQPSAIVITGNANPTVNVDVRDNGSNNGSNNSAVVTGNANPIITGNANVDVRDNGSNNSAVVTGNANPSVIITGNANDNGSNNSAVITGNANPVITGNANPTVVVDIRDNGSNNSAVITGNANPVITGNANPVVTGNMNDNGSNNSAVVTGNANPIVTGNMNDNGSNNSAVVTGNANPVVTGNLNDNGSNNSAVVTGNANPSVVVTGNANPVVTGNLNDNGSNNSAVVTGNANPNVIVTGNANPRIGGGLGSALAGSSGGDDQAAPGDAQGGSSVGSSGGLSDPRCVASLAGIGVPLLLAIPVALAQTVSIPGLEQAAAQIAGALDDAARNFGLQPTDLTAIGGGIVGAILAIAATAAATTCVPRVRTVEFGPKEHELTIVTQPVVDPRGA